MTSKIDEEKLSMASRHSENSEIAMLASKVGTGRTKKKKGVGGVGWKGGDGRLEYITSHTQPTALRQPPHYRRERK